MQLLGARLLTGASRNPMLAPFAAIIGVLIWFNLVAQVIMICAAFIAECRRGRGEPELATSAVSRQGNWHQALPDTISYETAASFIAGRKVHVFHEMCRRAYDERRVPMAIDVYGATWCGDCHRAKNALDRFGAAYTWHDIEQEEGAADRAVEISGQKHIPVVLYGDGSFQVEPSVVDIQNKLKELGLLR